MITTEVMGGLGNQLFQIFNLIAYSLTYKVPFFFEAKKISRLDRPFYWSNFLLSLRPFLRIAYDSKIPQYKEPNFHYDKIVQFNKITQPFKFFGYFQSYKYFQEQQESIYKFIKLDEQIDKIKSEYDYTNRISLHFRVGDYINLQQHHPVMKIDYYIKSLKSLINDTKKDNWTVLFFCEEGDIAYVDFQINLIKQELPNIIFEKIDSKYADWQQVLIMSLCQHHIIANSTFSWWGAYFNKNVDKQVYYPSLWFGPAQGEKNTDDLFPPKWNKIMC